MDEEELLHRYGLQPDGHALDEIRDLLTAQTARERREQGAGDTELMRLCCVQLFNAGALDDVLLIWQAKTASMDADCSIDIQLLCGAGLAETKTFLAGHPWEDAKAALGRLLMCEAAGDFDGFSAAEYSAICTNYYVDDGD
ncbi:hypothetical protein [Planomonospora venezuelensis]|uniref:Uncharacterized protein n=1 Tax=Planomonospora venezuelensis TaxID=1999 RepID=A0A841DJF4_PLAVE|nr:hypothetical protein [Planomonospora venezuelensis]MBB5968195.1 hypothetical protein [Planomonospora venezuelensis]GIN03316.1 hypothetical protein Pve01_49740 [Planomonospora venezuelensis]